MLINDNEDFIYKRLSGDFVQGTPNEYSQPIMCRSLTLADSLGLC
jgi:hypothetical protein